MPFGTVGVSVSVPHGDYMQTVSAQLMGNLHGAGTTLQNLKKLHIGGQHWKHDDWDMIDTESRVRESLQAAGAGFNNQSC